MGLVQNKKTAAERPLLWIGIGVVALSVIVLAAVVYLRMNQKSIIGDALAVVDGEGIYQEDLNDQIYGIDFQGSASTPQQVDNQTKKELLDKLVEWKIVEKQAVKLGVSVSGEEVSDRVADTLGNVYNDYTKFQKDLTNKTVKNDLLIEKITGKVVAWREGKFFVGRFDSAYENDRDFNNVSVKDGINREKAYALQLTTDLYNKLKAGTIKIDDAMASAESDTTIGKPTWGGDNATYTFSGTFNKKDSQNRSYFGRSPNFWDLVFKMNEGELSKPTVVKLTGTAGEHDALYAVIAVTDSNDSDYKSYSDWLSAMKKQYNVKYNVQY